jgi:hypothetical protein
MKVSVSLFAMLVVVGVQSRAEEPPPASKPDAPAATSPSKTDVRREASEKAARDRFHQPAVPVAQQAPAVSASPPAAVLDKVKADATKRLNATVEVASSERASWADGSMGCPTPGQFYTQMMTSGFRVLLNAGEQILDYRVADSGYFRLCSTAASLSTPDNSRTDR